MALRELLLSLGVEVDKQGVANADAALGKLKKAAIVAAGAFAAIKAVKGIADTVDGVREMGDEIDKTSQQLGLGVEALQEWRFAAGLAGVGGQEMSNSLGRLQKNAFEASKGNKKLAEDFERLGVSVVDAEGNLKDADTLLTEMSDGFQNLDNDSEKVALSLNLMGRTGRKLLPLFKDGSEGIAAMREEAQDLGGIMGQDLIDATVQLTDDQFRAQQAWQGIKNDIAQAVIPIFIKFSNVMISIAKTIRGPLKAAIQVMRTIFGVFADGAEILNEIFEGLGTALLALVPILATLGIALRIFGAESVLAAAKTAAAWIIAALPFLLIVATIALMLLALEDFIGFMQGKDSLIGRFLDGFRKWVKTMGGVSGAIGAIVEKLFKKIFGLSDETSRKIGGVFAAIAATVKFLFVELPTIIGESLAKAFLFISEWAGDFKDAIVAAIDFVVDAFDELTDAVADAIGEVAEFVGLGGDENVPSDAELRKIDRDRRKQRDKEFEQRVAIFKKLEQEGFGTAAITAETRTHSRGAGLTGIRDEAAAQARFLELQQDINAPLTVNVDARGRETPAAIGNEVAGKVSKAQSNRQIANEFSSAAVR